MTVVSAALTMLYMGTPLSEGDGEGALRVLLQLARASQSGDPYGVRFEPQDYLFPTAGGASPSARFEWTPELLADLEALRRPGCNPSVVQRLGQRLRAFVLAAGWAERERDIVDALAAQRPVFLTIRSSAAELYALPWELLTLKSGQFIGEVDGLLLRFEWPDSTSQPTQSTPRPEGGRILFAWSAAAGAVPAAEQLDAIAQACAAGHHPFDDSADVLAHASLSRITQRLTDAERAGSPVAVLHLLCHGAQAGDTFGLALDGEQGGVVVDATQLRQQLAPFAKGLRLIVLSACDSGNLGALGNRLGSVAQALHRCGVQSVLASRFPLSVAGSIALSETLYHTLLSGPCSLETAVLAARKRLAQLGTEQPQEGRMLDWASLQLYARHADGDDTRPVVFRPYRGLLAFEPAHRRFFFGRDKEVAEVVDDLHALIDRKQARFLVVAGASGTGKSSLVLAGAVPKLLSAHPDWVVLKMRPGNSPMAALTDALSKQPPQTPTVLVVDQLEEIFTQTASPAERQAFVRRLWSLSSAPDSGLHIVLTLRVDFIGRCGELVVDDAGLRLDRVAYDRQHQVFVAQLGPRELRATIEEPAARVGLDLHTGLADRIVQDVGAEPGALPLLEDALDVLWQQRNNRTLTQSAYEVLGGVVGALQKRADAILCKLSASDGVLAQRLLISLVAVADDTALDSRLRVPVAELRQSVAAADASGFERVLKELVNARLLVLDDDGQAPTVEVAHEALIRKWPRLRAWIDEDRAGLMVQRRVKQAAQLWDSQRRDESLLFRGAQRTQASEWRKTWESRLGVLERSFLNASEALQRRQEQEVAARLRQTRLAAVALAVLCVGAVGAGGLALRNAAVAKRSEAAAKQNEAAAQRNAAAARASLLVALSQNVKDDPTTVVNLLREPGHQDSTLWTQSAVDALQMAISQVVLQAPQEVASVAFSPDGTKIATGSLDKAVRIWNSDGSGSPIVRVGHEAWVPAVAFSPDGRKIATGSMDKTVHIWNADGSGSSVVLVGHEAGVYSVAFSPDGKKVVSGSKDRTARIWNADGSAAPIVLNGHEGDVYSVAFSPDGTKIATGSGDRTARIWNADGSAAPIVLNGHEGDVYSVAFSPVGTKIATGSADRTARIWNADGSAAPIVLKGHEGDVYSVGFSPDGTKIATGSGDRTARIWNADGSGAPIVLKGHVEPVSSIAFRPDGAKIVTGSFDKTARIWNANGSHAPLVIAGHADSIYSVAVSPDGKKIATGNGDKTARIWHSDGSGRPIVLVGHDAPVSSVTFNQDGTKIATGSADRTARIWNADGSGQPIVLIGHQAPVQCVAFSPDGTKIATSSMDKTLRLWSADGSGPPVVLVGHQAVVSAVAFSPDGKKIASGSLDGTVRAWNADGSGPPLLLKGNQSPIMALAFSPNGMKIVAGRLDKTAAIWNVDGSGIPIVLTGHSELVSSVAFSPDGTKIATGSRDATARIWQADGSGPPLLLKGHTSYVSSIAFSPDGKKVVSGSWDGTARSWILAGDRLLDALWHATSDCLPEQRRQELLAESPADAKQGHARCRKEVARRRGWPLP